MQKSKLKNFGFWVVIFIFVFCPECSNFFRYTSGSRSDASLNYFIREILDFGSISYAQNIKQPNASGTFYPSDPQALSNLINNFLRAANPEPFKSDIIALICPHAGYPYSGPVAAFGYKSIKDKRYDTVIILAPSHYIDFSGISIWPEGAFRTPLGDVVIDSEISKALLKESPKIYSFPEAFLREHSLEVQIPFLQKTIKDFKIIGLIMGRLSFDDLTSFAKVIKDVIDNYKDKKILIVASSDMSHYHPYKEANYIDNLTLEYIKNLKVRDLYEEANRGKLELCGLGPVITTLLYAQSEGLKAKVLKYANSGDITLDFNRVVGYTSVVFYKEGEPMKKEDVKTTDRLSKLQRKHLLEIARQSIEEYLKTQKRIIIEEKDPYLLKQCGAFVTLTKGGSLRGCIGHIVGNTVLIQTIRDMAIEAAVSDPRFPLVQLSELKNIEIEISVLSPLEKIDDINKIQVGKHGIFIRRGFYSGLLLPQVATEYGWDRDTFLEHTCYKAGLAKDAYKDSDIYIFSAEVFSEENY